MSTQPKRQKSHRITNSRIYDELLPAQIPPRFVDFPEFTTKIAVVTLKDDGDACLQIQNYGTEYLSVQINKYKKYQKFVGHDPSVAIPAGGEDLLGPIKLETIKELLLERWPC
jgi:hypothetical protein